MPFDYTAQQLRLCEIVPNKLLRLNLNQSRIIHLIQFIVANGKEDGATD